MDKAETKEYLSQSLELKNEINLLIQDKKEIESSAFGGSADYSNVSVKTSRVHDRMERLIIAAEEKQKQIDDLTWKYAKLKDDLINEIHQINDVLFLDILYYRYIKGYSMQQISKLCTHENRYGQRVHYDYKHICKAHNKALEAFAEVKEKATPPPT